MLKSTVQSVLALNILGKVERFRHRYYDIRMLILFLTLLNPLEASTLKNADVSAFIDTYYAYDFNRPQDHERQYTTQPVRDDEFNINLAFVDISINESNKRGRLALQTGNSVTKNYAYEPTLGTTSGSKDSKIMQEAFAGIKLSDSTWLDAGIFLGNIGMESWISKYNWTYSRSMLLDYVPYYSSGLRLEHSISSTKTLQVQLLNGWQNISESNRGKALGLQYKNKFAPNATFTYNNFLGDERIYENRKTRFRTYHNFILQIDDLGDYSLMGSFDVGEESQQDHSGVDVWFASSVVARKKLNDKLSMSMRGEYYNDRHEANVVTSTSNGFQVVGASVNLDKNLDQDTLFRTELRSLWSVDKIYPGNNRNHQNDTYLVASLCMTLN